MKKYEYVNSEDLNSFLVTDDPHEAVEYIIKKHLRFKMQTHKKEKINAILYLI